MYYVWKQQGDGPGFATANNIGRGNVGQTFKATQPKLVSVGLNLSGGKVTVTIRKDSSGGAIVATSASTPIVSFGETTVTFGSTPPTLTVGQTYYLEAVGDTGDMWAWTSNTNDYANGTWFLNRASQQPFDLNGRVTGRSS
jgi:hypothetical protein